MWIIKVLIGIAILYAISWLTDTQMGEVLTAALGFFLLIGVCVNIHEWLVNRISPRWHSSGEPGSGMDDGGG